MMCCTRTTTVVIGLLCLLSFVLVTAQPVQAGKLGDFEQEATEEDGPENYHDDDDGFLGALIRGFLRIFFWGDEDDDQSSRPSRSPRLRSEPRNQSTSDPVYNPVLWPAFRIDGAYQNVDSDVRALSLHSEVGLAFLALQGRFTYYREEEPEDDLWLNHIHGLLRIPVGKSVQVSPGMGAMIVDGQNRNSGFSLTLPVLVYPRDWIGIEYRPSWSWINDNAIDDHDLSVVMGSKHLAFKAGYRWVYTENETLNGAYFGMTVRF